MKEGPCEEWMERLLQTHRQTDRQTRTGAPQQILLVYRHDNRVTSPEITWEGDKMRVRVGAGQAKRVGWFPSERGLSVCKAAIVCLKACLPYVCLGVKHTYVHGRAC